MREWAVCPSCGGEKTFEAKVCWTCHVNTERPKRFWAKVRKGDGCWEWTGAVVRGGYGFFWDGKRNGVAHRYSWRIHNGPIPEGMVLCHKCDNPKCVNPEHLFLGTYTDNEQDKLGKGRNPHVKTVRGVRMCLRGHPLPALPDYSGRHRCKECRRIRRRLWRTARKLESQAI